MVEIKKAIIEDLEECRVWDKFNKNEILREKIDREFIYLAFLDGKCVGYLRWDFFWNRLPYLCLIKVAKEHRNKGIGKELLNTWINDLKVDEHKYCLSSSEQNEPPAIEWHYKQGFREIGQLSTLNEDGSVEIFLRREI